VGIDEDVLELARAALEKVDAVAGAWRANGQAADQDVRVEESLAEAGGAALVRLPRSRSGE